MPRCVDNSSSAPAWAALSCLQALESLLFRQRKHRDIQSLQQSDATYSFLYIEN